MESEHHQRSNPSQSGFMQSFENLLNNCRDSRKLVLVVVAIGLLLDNMLLTSVGMEYSSTIITNQIVSNCLILSLLVPIIPAFLYELNHRQDLAKINRSMLDTSIEDQTVTTKTSIKEDENFLAESRLLSYIFSPKSSLYQKLSPDCEKVVCL